MNKLKFLLRCVISSALVYFLLRNVDWRKLGRALELIDWRLAVLASILVPLLIVALAFRWRIFLRQQGINLPFSTIFPLTWAGQFFNSVLPGSTGGDVMKIYQLCRLFPDRKAAAAASVLVDRFTALVALVVLAGTALIIDPVPLKEIENLPGSTRTRILTLIAIGLIALGAAWLAYRFIRSSHWRGRLQRTFAALKSSLVISPLLFGAMVISLCIHCLNFFIVFLFARSLGIDITYFQVLLIYPVILLLVMLPVTVNGHGLRELVVIYYFTHLHIAITGNPTIGVSETVWALSAVLVPNDLLWSIPGGLWYLLRFQRAEVFLEGSSPK